MAASRLWVLGFALVGVAFAGRSAGAFEPSPIPRNWELNFSFDDLQRIDVNGQTYWYMLYSVVNNSGEDVNFFPNFELVTDDLVVVRNMLTLPAGVFDAIQQRHGDRFPHMVQPNLAIGRLLQGEDNGVDSVAVFPQLPADANQLTIYVGGLSGESIRVRNPAWTQQSPESVPETFIITKTLRIPYRVPGDEQTRDLARPVRLRAPDFVMR